MNVMRKTMTRAIIKILSAILSSLLLLLSSVALIDKKEKKQLVVRKIQVTPVNSSIKDTSLNLVIFNEVKTTRQKPSKLDEVFRI